MATDAQQNHQEWEAWLDKKKRGDWFPGPAPQGDAPEDLKQRYADQFYPPGTKFNALGQAVGPDGKPVEPSGAGGGATLDDKYGTPGKPGTTDQRPWYGVDQESLDSAARASDRSKTWQDEIQSGARAAGGRRFTGYDYGNANQARGQQMGLLQDVMNSARGVDAQGRPVSSVAQLQLQKATDNNIAATRALAASQRGLGHSAAQRQVATQSAAQRQQLGADASILRLQEQQQNRDLAMRLGQGIRESDIAQANQIAGFNMQQAQLNDQQIRGLTQLAMQALAGDRDAMVAIAQLKAGIYNNAGQLGLGYDTNAMNERFRQQELAYQKEQAQLKALAQAGEDLGHGLTGLASTPGQAQPAVDQSGYAQSSPGEWNNPYGGY